MKLRPFRPEDADTICSWVTSEEDVYKWSADRIAKFPVYGSDLVANFESSPSPIFPLTAYDENGDEDVPIGHLFIRWPSADPALIRFGFIILDPAYRGQGLGKKLVELASEYARDTFKAKKGTLAVFENNPEARHCYEAAGYKEVGERFGYQTAFGEWMCALLEKDL